MSKVKDPETVRELAPAEHNPRTITEARSAQLGKSMSRFGDLSGIVYNRRTQRLVCGHQRIKHLAANARIRKDPHTDEQGTVAIGRIVSGARASWIYREVDWDDATEKAACIAANAAGGDFDEGKLAGLVIELDKVGFEMDLLNLRSLEDILSSQPTQPEATDDLPSVGKKAVSKRGDVYVCGDHRVMCGSSTSREDMQKLMGNEPAAMIWTDPPYGVSYASEDFDVIQGDHKRDDELYALVLGALKQAVSFSRQDAGFYIWHASSTRREFDDALRDAGLIEKQYLIWVKNALVMGRSDYQWAHEPCYYACKEGQRAAWHGGRDKPTIWRATLRKREGSATTLGQALILTDGSGGQIALTPRLPKGKKSRGARLAVGETIRIETQSNSSTVLEIGRDQDYVHPTQKPIELARTSILNSSRPGEIVLDCFGGSGTSLIACEATGRKGRAMELDPIYVDAIVKRWEEMTGRKAEKEKR